LTDTKVRLDSEEPHVPVYAHPIAVKTATHREAIARLHDQLKNPDNVAIFSTSVASTLVVLPVLAATGLFFPQLADEGRVPLGAFVALGGLLGFTLYYPDRDLWFLGVLPGLIAGPFAFFSTMYYTTHRETLHTGEFLIPLALGVTPAFALYYALLRLVAVKRLKCEVDPDEQRLQLLADGSPRRDT
jgi:hypothetical protein